MIDAILQDSYNEDEDLILPWLCSIKKALDDFNQTPDTSGSDLDKLLADCVNKFKDDERYRNDVRFLQIWILYADSIQDFEKVFRILEEKKICIYQSILYEAYAMFLEIKGKLIEADGIYRLGIFREAEPLERLKRKHASFLNHMSEIVNACSRLKVENAKSIKHGNSSINPWSTSVINDLLRKMDPQILKYNGYHHSNKIYSGKVPLSSLQHYSRNKIVELGGKKYQIKGCSGQGGFAQVYRAYLGSNSEDPLALKIQKPAYPWEFYMYRQLDQRIPDQERPSFGFAHNVHIFSDCSVLVCDYLAHGTLQDAINSYVVVGQSMEEVLCIYYCTEMLRMLETLHSVGIIHGDFKPDNLLVRYAKDDLEEDDFHCQSGTWRDQGLCLVDWGKGIDLSLFPDGTVFEGDCRTSGFRCVEMQEKRPWTFQVDSYGLCAIVHMMLHGNFMSIEKKPGPDGSHLYQPKSTLKRYWNVDLWKNLFKKLLNVNLSDDQITVLRSLRKSFEDYMCGDPHLIKKLKQLLVKQRASLCSS